MQNLINGIEWITNGPLDMEKGVIIFRQWKNTALELLASLLRGEKWIRGLPPKFWNVECLNCVGDACEGMLLVDEALYKSPSPECPRLKLKAGDLNSIPRIFTLRLNGDVTVIVEVEIWGSGSNGSAVTEERCQ